MCRDLVCTLPYHLILLATVPILALAYRLRWRSRYDVQRVANTLSQQSAALHRGDGEAAGPYRSGPARFAATIATQEPRFELVGLTRLTTIAWVLLCIGDAFLTGHFG